VWRTRPPPEAVLDAVPEWSQAVATGTFANITLMTATYQVYGLSLRANRPLPGLLAAAAGNPIDVEVSLLLSATEPPDSLPQEVCGARPERYLCDHDGFTAWAVEGDGGRYLRLHFTNGHMYSDYTVNPPGSRVWARSNPSMGAGYPAELLGDLVHSLTRRVAGAVLRQRGVTCLHANTVVVGGQAIAIMGESGLGKSSTTAGLVARGHPMLADDIAALAEQAAGFHVQPGLPRLALDPEVVETVFGLTAPAPNPLRVAGKHYFELASNGSPGVWRFHPEPLPLAAIYVLAPFSPESAVPVIEPVEGGAKLVTLRSHSYLHYVLESDGRRREFERLGRLAARVPMRRVQRPLGLEHLPPIADAIVADALALGAQQ